MATRPATELLYDSEASYRLVDRALGEFSPVNRVIGGTDPLHPGDVRGLIREELFGLIAHLHFQDISSQQLAYASHVISEMQEIFRGTEDGQPLAPIVHERRRAGDG
jgi:hypothetical protein